MPSGGKRPGAGRKAGGGNRPAHVIEAERVMKEMERQARAARKKAAAARREAARHEKEARTAEGKGPPPARPERIKAEILPPLPDDLEIPPGGSSLEFLKRLMDDQRLPLGFRRDCAALALPYEVAKPILGLKDARRFAAFDDDGDDPMAAAMRE